MGGGAGAIGMLFWATGLGRTYERENNTALLEVQTAARCGRDGRLRQSCGGCYCDGYVSLKHKSFMKSAPQEKHGRNL